MANGNCAEFAYDAIPEYHEWGNVHLCHGFPTMQGLEAGIVGFHAWLELGGVLVIDCGTIEEHRVAILRDAYYHVGKIRPEYVARYSPAEAYRLTLEHETFGYWHEPDPRSVDAGQ